MTIIKDGYLFEVKDNGQRRLRLFAPDLPDAIPYILSNGVSDIALETNDPIALYEWYKTRDESIIYNMRKMDSIDVDILPLESCKDISALHLAGNVLHSEVLEGLPALQILSINNTSNRQKIHIDRLKALRTLWVLKWARNILGIENTRTLRELRLWNYCPKSRDLSEINQLQELADLELISPRIDSLDGVEQLSSLKRIGIFYSRTLKDISALDKCNIEKIEFEHCPKIGR